MVDERVEARLLSKVRQSRADLRTVNLRLLEAPPLFDLELVSACNVVCTFCPRGEMERQARRMDAATFEAVLRFLPAGAVAMLSGLGDALLHPDLPDHVARLTARGVSTCVITNGVRLTPDRQDDLLAAGIAEIQVSVHALDEGTARRVMPVGAAPELVRTHVERLAGTRRCRVRVNFVETDANAHARAEVEAWTVGLGARFFHRRLHTRGGALGTGRSAEHGDGCGIYGSVTFISADGDVLPCVNDVRGEGRLGHVRGLTWGDVLAWKHRVISEARWFAACRACDDDYRWVLLSDGGLAGA